MPLKPGEIPIADAADICKRRGCAYVVVFGVREDGERFHVTTYGKTKALCRLAGAIGDQIAEAVLSATVRPPKSDPGELQAALLAACREALPFAENAIRGGIDNPDVLAHALENHGVLKALRGAIAAAKQLEGVPY